MIIWSGTFVLKQNYIIDFALCFAVYFVYDVHCISHWCTITVLAETKLFCSYKKRQRKMWFLWQIDRSVRDYLLKPCKEVLLSLLYPNRKKSPCLSFQAQVILNKWTNTDDSLCSIQPEDLHEREQTWSEILQSR